MNIRKILLLSASVLAIGILVIGCNIGRNIASTRLVPTTGTQILLVNPAGGASDTVSAPNAEADAPAETTE